MQQIDNQQFGQFLTELRKENGLTQRQLAEKLYVSDKAVSKWERGVCLPDISLLIPLAQTLSVTTTELLCGKRLENNTHLTLAQVDLLMNKTIGSAKESGITNNQKQKSIRLYFTCLAIFALEMLGLFLMGYDFVTVSSELATVAIIMFVFGTYFTFFVKSTLPKFYDENNLNFYSDGVFRMNMPGVSFNNSNWGSVIKALQKTVMCVLIGFPLLYFVISYLSPRFWQQGKLFFTLISVFTIFIPIYTNAKNKAQG